MVTGTEKDLHTVETVLARLQPRCPRCRGKDVTPLTWCDMVMWFQCPQCYKLWHEDLNRVEAMRPAPMTSHASTQPQGHSVLHPCSTA
jgi:hypothetical protein